MRKSFSVCFSILFFSSTVFAMPSSVNGYAEPFFEFEMDELSTPKDAIDLDEGLDEKEVQGKGSLQSLFQSMRTELDNSDMNSLVRSSLAQDWAKKVYDSRKNILATKRVAVVDDEADLRIGGPRLEEQEVAALNQMLVYLNRQLPKSEKCFPLVHR